MNDPCKLYTIAISHLQGLLLFHREKITVMLSFVVNLLVLDGLLALFGATLRGPGIINKNFYEVFLFVLVQSHETLDAQILIDGGIVNTRSPVSRF